MQLSNGTRKGIAALIGLMILGNLARVPTMADSTAGYAGAAIGLLVLGSLAYWIWPTAPDEPAEGEQATT